MANSDTDSERRKSELLLKQQLKGSRSSPRSSGASNSPTTPGSPSAKFFPDITTIDNSPTTSDTDTNQKKKGIQKKNQCPCGVSSGGESWIIPCFTCKQTWHNSCAGLKASFTKPVLSSLAKSWQCPWCFICPFQRPKNHLSDKNVKELGERILCADVIQKISESVSNEISKTIETHAKVDVDGLKSQLDTLSQSLKDFCGSQEGWNPRLRAEDCLPDIDMNHEPMSVTEECKEKPVCESKENYLVGEEMEGIKQLLTQAKESKLFKTKNGRSTLSFGEHYKYSGSSDKPHSKEFPPSIQQLINKVASDHGLEENEAPNSVLINYFPEKVNARSPKSSLPKHSDDEIEIEADSKIFTYSVGGPRTITFSGIHTGETVIHEATSNSLYTMSRKSQAWFKHEIVDAETCQERFSITLRRINANNKRSILLMGDSNSKAIKFGSGAGTVGEKYPGKRIKAAKIDEIDPRECVGFANIVLACGTNDLRPSSVIGEPKRYISGLVDSLRHKVEQIHLLTHAKIFIMPVPPTRDPKMNQFVQNFNTLVEKSDISTRFDAWMPGLYSFLDKSGLLNVDLTRGGDSIHFGSRGISKYVSLLKEVVYQRERAEFQSEKGRNQQGNRQPYSGSQEPP